MYDLAPLENVQNKPQRPAPNNPKKRGFLKTLLVFVLVLVFIGVVVGNAVYTVILKYSTDFEPIIANLELLSLPVNEETLITDPIVLQDQTDFIQLANTAGFSVFVDGVVDLEQENITLTQELTLTDSQLGAFMNLIFIDGGQVENSDIEFKELVIFTGEGSTLYLKTIIKIDIQQIKTGLEDLVSAFPSVFGIDLTTMQDSVQGVVDLLPQYLYLTTISEIEVENNELMVPNSVARVNELDPAENLQIVNFINNLFGNSDGEYTFTELISVLVAEQLSVITTKTGATLSFEEGLIKLTPAI